MNPKTNSGSTPDSQLRSGLSNGPPTRRGTLLGIVRWCIAHRRRVVVVWVAVAVLATVLAGSVGRQYASDFSLPGTESQRASDLLKREFRAQSGDVDTIVFHVSQGTIDSPAVRGAIAPLLARVSKLAARRRRGQSLQPRAERSRSRANRMTAFATVNYDKPANQLPEQRRQAAARPRSRRCTCRACGSPPGGQVIEQAEGFSVGPATAVGVIAALMILLLTFGSLDRGWDAARSPRASA